MYCTRKSTILRTSFLSAEREQGADEGHVLDRRPVDERGLAALELRTVELDLGGVALVLEPDLLLLVRDLDGLAGIC